MICCEAYSCWSHCKCVSVSESVGSSFPFVFSCCSFLNTRTILSCCPLHNIIYSVLAITCLFYTENGCTHTPIALAVFRTKLFPSLQSRETHIGVGGLWGGWEGERWHFLALWQKEMYLLPSFLLVGDFCRNRLFSLNIRPSVTYRQRPFCKIPNIRFFLVYQSLCLTFCVGVACLGKQ